ncbi:MAG: hypothetical protein ACRD44_08850 [Bryobacteraceae bacterium]
MMRQQEPAYLGEMSGALTWFDTWRDLNAVRPAPWDPYTLERFKALARAMAEHPVPDSTKGGSKTRLRDHPVIANVNFGIPGAHAAIRSPVQFRLIDMPGYTREKFKSAVLESLHAMTDNFPSKAAYIGFWTVQDGQSPALWEEIQSAIHSEFDGIRNPKVGFFQENLAASKDSSTGAITGTPRTTFAAPLYLSRDQTPILFQALQAWNNPFSNPAQTANTTPADALQFAYDTYRAKYFELYVNDLDDRKYWDSFTQWNDRLCQSEPGSDDSGAINVLFTIHFDPLQAPGGQVSRTAYEGQRDNLAWLADYFDEIERSSGAAFAPKLTLEIAGDHAEYYSEDPVGLALLQRLHARGHELAIHFHTNYKTGSHQWMDGQSQNTPEMRRRVTEDHIKEVDALVAKVIGNSDPAAVRRANHTIQGHFTDEAYALEQGFDIITTGQTEILNSFFDHDPWNPFRLRSVAPGASQLQEDLNGPWIMVPSASVLGAIGRHTVWVDVSPAAMRRKFLNLLLERRNRRLGGATADERVWAFGWHEHLANISANDGVYGNIANLRDEVIELVSWLNHNFIGQRDSKGALIARYATASEVASELKSWEEAHRGQSSFNYARRTTDWEAYPYQLRGLTSQLMNSHHESEIPGFRAEGVHAHKLLKTDDQNWSFRGGQIVSSSATWPIYLMWSDEGEVTIDLSGSVASELTCVAADANDHVGVSADPRGVRVGATPVVCTPKQ